MEATLTSLVNVAPAVQKHAGKVMFGLCIACCLIGLLCCTQVFKRLSFNNNIIIICK